MGRDELVYKDAVLRAATMMEYMKVDAFTMSSVIAGLFSRTKEETLDAILEHRGIIVERKTPRGDRR